MVYIVNIREADIKYDKNIAIVRSLKSKSKLLVQEPLLAPSSDLFNRYLLLRYGGKWNKDTFDSIYVPQFLRELKANRPALDKLNEIYKSSKSIDIALCCFCTDEALCHRSIIAGLLQGVGCDVVTHNGDYSKYYKMYKTL